MLDVSAVEERVVVRLHSGEAHHVPFDDPASHVHGPSVGGIGHAQGDTISGDPSMAGRECLGRVGSNDHSRVEVIGADACVQVNSDFWWKYTSGPHPVVQNSKGNVGLKGA